MKQKLNPVAIIVILVAVLGVIFGVLYKMTEAPISSKPGGMGGDPGVRVGTRPEDQPPPKVKTGEDAGKVAPAGNELAPASVSKNKKSATSPQVDKKPAP